MQTAKERLLHDLYIVLAAASALTLLGIVFVYSASALYALERLGNAHYFFAQHFIAVLLAAVIGYVCSRLPLRMLYTYSDAVFATILCILGITLIFNGNLIVAHVRYWLSVSGYRFIMSEIIKLVGCVYIGAFLARAEDEGWSFIRCSVPLALMALAVGSLLVSHRAINTAMVMGTTMLIVCLVARCTPSYITALCSSGMAGMAAYLWWLQPQALFSLVCAQPWTDASLLSLGSGGWWGAQGLYAAPHFVYRPLQQVELIFSCIGQTIGFMGCLALIAAYLLFAVYGMRLVLQLHSLFAAYMTLGFMVCIMLQVLGNMVVATGIAPLGHFCLPFVSFGGSELLILGGMLGLMVNAVREQTA